MNHAHEPSNDFELTLQQLRDEPVAPPRADAVLDAVLDARTRSAQRVGRARGYARAALAFAALSFLLVPYGRWLWARRFRLVDPEYLIFGTATGAVLAMFLLGLGAWLVARPSFRSQLMWRAIAASNLVVGTLLAISGSGFASLAGALVASGCATALWMLGASGLEPQEPDHPFSPVAYRGFLVMALVMAFADAQTLLFSSAVQASTLLTATPYQATQLVQNAGLTLVAGTVMAINVWGLYRLRVWAMIANILANLVIAGLALGGALGLNLWVAGALAGTATIQLLLPVPILARALGDQAAGRWAWGWGKLRWAVMILVGCAVIFAVPTLGEVRSDDDWIEVRSVRRGAVAPPTADWERVHWTGHHRGEDFSGADLGGARFIQIDLQEANFAATQLRYATFGGADLQHTNFAGADLSGARIRNSDLRNADLRGADLRGATLVGTALTGAELEGARFGETICPDFTRSDEVGGSCAEHRGTPVSEETRALVGRYAADGVKILTDAWSDELQLEQDGDFVRDGEYRFIRRPDGSYVAGRRDLLRRFVPVRDPAGAIVALDYSVGEFEAVRLARRR